MKRIGTLWVGATLFFGSAAVLWTEQLFLGLRPAQTLLLLAPGWILAPVLAIYAPHSCRMSLRTGSGAEISKAYRKWGWAGLLLIDVMAALWGTFFLLTFNEFPHGPIQTLGGATGTVMLGLVGAWVIQTWEESRLAWALGLWTGVLLFIVIGISGFGAQIFTTTGVFVVLILYPTGVPFLVTVDLIMIMGPMGAEISSLNPAASPEGAPVEERFEVLERTSE